MKLVYISIIVYIWADVDERYAARKNNTGERKVWLVRVYQSLLLIAIVPGPQGTVASMIVHSIYLHMD